MVDQYFEQMTPQLILSLWRERWGKSEGHSSRAPYIKGRLDALGESLSKSLVWSWPGVAKGALGLCLMLFTLIILAPFSQNSQIVFSIILLLMALYSRRYYGIFVSQLLFGLSFISSARYLYWRFSSTLGQNLDADFVLGFCLCVSELYLYVLICVDFIKNLCPLKQPSVLLPIDSADWPTVDVFISGHDHSYSAIKSSVIAALALEWPRKKIKTFILDQNYRSDINKLADSLGVQYKFFPNNLENAAGRINSALADSKSELIAIFDDEVPHQQFLKDSVGWFLSDTKLGMIQTPNHFLAPTPFKRSLKIFDESIMGGSCALMRRTMLLAVGGVSMSAMDATTHTALKFQEQGYIDAYIGFSRLEEAVGSLQISKQGMPKPSSLQVFRVDHPFLGDRLHRMQLLINLEVMLRFYYIVPRMIFFIAPLAYLLLEVRIIQAPLALFAAYALPHFLFVHFVRTRMQGSLRFSLWGDIRETMLAWYMLFPTAVTLARTKIVGSVRALKQGCIKQDESFDWVIAIPFAVIGLMSVAGLVVGIIRLLSLDAVDSQVAILYLLWTVYNLMILSAILAVAEESRYVLKYRKTQLCLPAMIKLPLGRSVYCTTVNFPEPSLVLALPTYVELETGAELNVSIFQGYRECLFAARVASVNGTSLCVNIEESAKKDYHSFGSAVFSRGKDWPKWLPSRDADHPLPVWMIKAVAFVNIAVLGFIRPLCDSALGMRLGGWIQIWKKRK